MNVLVDWLIDLLKAYSPVNRTGSNEGFLQVQVSHKLSPNTISILVTHTIKKKKKSNIVFFGIALMYKLRSIILTSRITPQGIYLRGLGESEEMSRLEAMAVFLYSRINKRKSLIALGSHQLGLLTFCISSSPLRDWKQKWICKHKHNKWDKPYKSCQSQGQVQGHQNGNAHIHHT